MNRCSAAAAVVIFAVGCASAPPPSAEHHPTSNGREEFLRRQLVDEHGAIPRDAMRNALAQMARMKAAAPQAAGVSRASWTWIGPGNVGGRVTTILTFANDPNTLLINNPGGGIWKSANAGATWQPVNDFMQNLAVSALAANPANPAEIYAGTGGGPNSVDGGFESQLRGAGMFKSSDGGTTWTQLASTSAVDFSNGIERIAISPDGKTVLASAKFVYADVPAAILRSTDGGQTWSDTLKLPQTSGNSVEFNPKDATQAIASSLTKAYTSGDGGATLTEASGLNAPDGAKGLVAATYAKSDPSIVYASVNTNGGEVYRSTDGGKSYALVNTGTKYLGTQGWYCNVIWVDPTNANTVVVAGLDIYRSTDGGRSFTKISKWQKPAPKSAHADHGAIAAASNYDGASVKTVYFGNDGGIYKADLADVQEEAGWQLLNNALGITQFYGVAANGNGVVVAGAQDNGSQRFTGDLQNWTPWQGGDGGYVAADPNDPNFFYGEYVYGTIYRTGDGGASQAEDIYGISDSFDGTSWTKKARPGAITEAADPTANFIAPFILDPNDPNRLLLGARSLWMTNNAKAANADGGPLWTAIKPPAGDGSDSNVGSIAVARGDSNTIWVGHNNGAVYTTAHGLAATPDWTKTGDGTLPKRFATRIAIDPRNAKTVYVAFGGFSADNLWRTTDGGASWTSVTGSGATQLPQVPIYAVAIHPNNSRWLYVGTEIGVFTSADGGATWNVPTDGPANVSVKDLEFAGTTLYAATFGRGVYKIDITNTAQAKATGCYTLSLSSDGDRGGVLANVAPNCNGGTQYLAGTSVRLTARGRAPYALASWSGDASGSARTTTVVMNANKSVAAHFSADATCYTLTMNVQPANGGSVTLDPPPNCGSNGYTAGTEVEFDATPKNGYAFGGWDGDYFDVDPIGSLTMDENHTVVATFAIPASNDYIANAIDLGNGNSSASIDTSNASTVASDPEMCVAGKSGKTVWFKFTAPANGALTVDTNGTNYRTVVQVLRGSPASLTRVGCSDQALPGTPVVQYGDAELASDELAAIRIVVTKATTYYIEVGDATMPDRKESDDFDTGDDPTDVPDGGLLQLHATFTAGTPKHRAAGK